MVRNIDFTLCESLIMNCINIAHLKKMQRLHKPQEQWGDGYSKWEQARSSIRIKCSAILKPYFLGQMPKSNKKVLSKLEIFSWHTLSMFKVLKYRIYR